MKKYFILLLALLNVLFIFGQDAQVASVNSDSDAKASVENEKKATEWVSELQLNDTRKEKKLVETIRNHLNAVRDWNNTHPFTTVPPGINPVTGSKLSELDRQVIANSAMPSTVHEALMNGLKSELSSEQVEKVLDKYTIGKVEFTLKGYKAIVPDLTKEEEAKITEYLKQAREQAVDYKSMKQISAIFEIYKTKCEQYLNSNGRNWRQLYKAYTDKIKAQKEADKRKTN